jgi:quinol monooxygenase YgiN
MPITNIAFFRARPGQETALGELLTELAEPSRRESGCIDYALHQSPDTPALWFVYENWRSEDDLHAHFETEHLRHFAQTAAPLMSGDMTLGLFTPVLNSRDLARAA